MVHISRRSFVAGAAVSAVAPFVLPVIGSAQDVIPDSTVEATFIHSIDGEKLRVRIGVDFKDVRLIGADAPEIATDANHTECFAFDAKDLLTNLLGDKATIYLEPDLTDKDSHDRLWRYVWATINGAPVMLNEWIIAQGGAVATTDDKDKNVKYHQRLIAAQKTAQTSGAGLWGACDKNAHKEIPRHGSKEDPGAWGDALIGESVSVTPSNLQVVDSYNYSTPKGGYKWLIFDAYIINLGDDKKNYEDRRWQCRDLDTNAVHKLGEALLDQPLDQGDLSSSSYVSGQVCLEVQETDTNLLVQYQISTSGDTILYWTLDLS